MSRPQKAQVTIQDVAKRAGVAKTTVSHAISGKRPVASETRARIFAAMQELNFRPNPIARRLAGGASHALALVYPLASPALSAVELRFINSIAEVVNRSEYSFLTLSSPHVAVSDLHQIISSGLVDGIILMRIYLSDARVQLLQNENMPFVMVGRTADPQDLVYVDLDSVKAIGMALAHLAQLGHRRVAFIHPDDTEFGFAYRLLEGHQRACQSLDMEVITEPASLSDAAGHRAMLALLQRVPELTAAIVWSDVVTMGVMRALNEHGRSIPGDLSVVSFDRSDQLRLASSDLTIVDTCAEEVGATAARMLLDLLAGRTLEHRQVLIKPELRIGESTGPCVAARVSSPAMSTAS